MQRVTVTLDDDLIAEIDKFQQARGYQNRSEALRDLTRAGLQQSGGEGGEGACVAALVYVFDHETRALAKRLASAQHHRHDLSVATLHVHLDHDSCLEVAVLRGAKSEVRHFADHVMAERGGRHGRLVGVPVEITASAHAHGGENAATDSHTHAHVHAHVREAG